MNDIKKTEETDAEVFDRYLTVYLSMLPLMYTSFSDVKHLYRQSRQVCPSKANAKHHR